jgi:hypothetical protein
MNRLRRVSILLLAGTTAGCYVQQPIETAIPAPATRIVAQLTDSGAVAVGGRLGPGAVEVEGVVASADESAWNLNLLRVSYRGGTSSTWNKELVSFPRFALSNATERHVDKTRSWVVAGLIGAGAILASRLFSESGSGGGDGDGGGPTPQSTRVLPLLFYVVH